MNWQYIDRRMKEGSSLFKSTIFGAWLVHADGAEENANANAVKAIFRRDLVVLEKRCSDHTYKFRHRTLN